VPAPARAASGEPARICVGAIMRLADELTRAASSCGARCFSTAEMAKDMNPLGLGRFPAPCLKKDRRPPVLFVREPPFLREKIYGSRPGLDG